ncbi:MAG: TlpA family protein disulfide reductase [Anaerolineales bacterium]|nr:TlpA family protein disulfide reductase [Anaerolineales bacterium]
MNPFKKYEQIWALTFLGLGLIALGIAAFLWKDRLASAAASSDFSAIPATTNYPAPEMNLVFALDGEPATLSDYRGSVVLVNLWATWCPPCKEEMPTLQSFYEKYKSQGFVLLAINQGETEAQVTPFIREFGLTFPVWLDQSSETGRAFQTLNLPSSYVIDRDGQVRLMWIGGISKKNLEKYVPTLIKE